MQDSVHLDGSLNLMVHCTQTKFICVTIYNDKMILIAHDIVKRKGYMMIAGHEFCIASIVIKWFHYSCGKLQLGVESSAALSQPILDL